MRVLMAALFVSFCSSVAIGEEAKTIAEPTVLTTDEQSKFEDLFNDLTKEVNTSQFKEKGWPRLELTWETSSIPVCWENATEDNKWYRSIVQQSIVDTWQSHSGITFSGWENCVSGNRGIRILIADQGPHTKGLGTLLDGKKNGMVLNATYQNWSPSCQNRLAYCSYVIAVHEFGHALGFAHDQNRPDTPEHCDLKQGSDGSPETVSWTPWDEKSVMNYCNPKWSNGGRLSKFDIYLVQRLYGKP
ncbi:MAG: M12 family metallopeptidase [Alphaproteobacteria bacterium]|nr:M12 family metallopeptidase [Alphaproteobacteria bacterium]